MQLYSEHAIFGWLIIIGAVCMTIILGAVLDRFMHNHRSKSVKLRTKAVPVTIRSSYRRNFRNMH